MPSASRIGETLSETSMMRPSLRASLGLEVVHPLAASDTLQDLVDVLGVLGRHQDGDVPADDLGGGVAEDPLGGPGSSS